MEKNTFACDLGYFLDIGSFVRRRTQVLGNNIYIENTSIRDVSRVLTFFGVSIYFLARNLVPRIESEEHSFLYLVYFYHIRIILRLMVYFF